MDYLEKYEAEQEARREFLDRQAMPQQADQRPRTDMPETDYPVTIIGCIRGVDGWYRAGFNHRKRTIVPLDRIELRNINKDCPTCNRSDPETNICREASTIRGGTPCVYWFPRGRKQFAAQPEETA